MKRAGGNSSGSSLSVTSSLSKEANTNLIAHNNNGLPLRTSSLNEETNTNLIAHNDSGKINLYNSNYPWKTPAASRHKHKKHQNSLF